MEKEDLEKLREDFSEDFDDIEIAEDEFIENQEEIKNRRIKKPYIAS